MKKTVLACIFSILTLLTLTNKSLNASQVTNSDIYSKYNVRSVLSYHLRSIHTFSDVWVYSITDANNNKIYKEYILEDGTERVFTQDPKYYTTLDEAIIAAKKDRSNLELGKISLKFASLNHVFVDSNNHYKKPSLNKKDSDITHINPINVYAKCNELKPNHHYKTYAHERIENSKVDIWLWHNYATKVYNKGEGDGTASNCYSVSATSKYNIPANSFRNGYIINDIGDNTNDAGFRRVFDNINDAKDYIEKLKVAYKTHNFESLLSDYTGFLKLPYIYKAEFTFSALSPITKDVWYINGVPHPEKTKKPDVYNYYYLNGTAQKGIITVSNKKYFFNDGRVPHLKVGATRANIHVTINHIDYITNSNGELTIVHG